MICAISAVVVILRTFGRSQPRASVTPWITTFFLGAGLLASALMPPGSLRIVVTGALVCRALFSLGVEIKTSLARKYLTELPQLFYWHLPRRPERAAAPCGFNSRHGLGRWAAALGFKSPRGTSDQSWIAYADTLPRSARNAQARLSVSSSSRQCARVLGQCD